MDLKKTKTESESERQEKNRLIVEREVLCLFSYPMQTLIEKNIIDFGDFENLYLSDEQIKENWEYDLKNLTEEEKKEFIQDIRDRGEDFEEVYEYWIVTEWFYERLKELGEVVTEWENLYIWGRCTTGQEIALDYTIDKVRDYFNKI